MLENNAHTKIYRPPNSEHDGTYKPHNFNNDWKNSPVATALNQFGINSDHEFFSDIVKGTKTLIHEHLPKVKKSRNVIDDVLKFAERELPEHALVSTTDRFKYLNLDLTHTDHLALIKRAVLEYAKLNPGLASLKQE